MDIKLKIRTILLKEIKGTGRVLYLHGFGSNPEKEKIDKDIKFLIPSLDYEEKPLYDYLSKLIKTKNIVAIIGHSIGGYLAYYLSNEHKIPCLMFNPAFEDSDLKFQPISEDIKKIKPFVKQMAIIGINDDEIPMSNQIKSLQSSKCVIFKEKIGHDIPLDVKNKYIDKFLKNFDIN